MFKVSSTIVWFGVGLLLLVTAAAPVGIPAQFFLGLTAVLGMIFIKFFRLKGVWRHVFLALGTTVVVRYIYWRTTSTLPPVDDLFNFIPGILLWSAEIFSMLMLAISLFVIADPLERKPATRYPNDQLPTVDVFIPTYNEERELLAVTMAAAKSMDYPPEKLTVYLLDDGGSDQKCNQSDPEKAKAAQERRADLTQLAEDLGCIYHTRAKNEHAKAGNMNAALPHSKGELIAIFDADHAPMRQFLSETVGHYLEDPKLFLVQTPHFFTNPDPIEKNLNTFDRMPSENEMFYGIIQKGLDKWNAAFFCGSAALIRRAPVEMVGGFSGVSITEDCETALDLHSRGWNSLYVDKPLISGLQPETYLSFIGQRSRWCRGMVQLIILKNPLFKSGLKFSQRIAYLSNMLFWMFPLARLPFFVSPLLYIFFSMQIYVANSQEFIAYTILYMCANMLMQNYLYGSVRWPWISELYEFVQSMFLARGIISVFLNPRAPTFEVTAKGQTLDENHMSGLARPYYIAWGVLLFASLVVFWRLAMESGSKDLLIVVGIWNTFNLLLASVSLGVVAERRERRKTARMNIERDAELVIGAVIVPVKIVDVSAGGLRIRAEDGLIPRHLQAGAQAVISLHLQRADKQLATLPIELRVRGSDDTGPFFGFQYVNLKPQHYLTIVDLMYCDAQVIQKFRDGRRSHKGVFAGVFTMFAWGFSEPVRAFSYIRSGNKAGAAVPVPAVIGVLAAIEAPAFAAELEYAELKAEASLAALQQKIAVGQS